MTDVNKNVKVFNSATGAIINNCTRFHSYVGKDNIETVKLVTIQPFGENASDVQVVIRGAVSQVKETLDSVEYYIQVFDEDDPIVSQQISDEISELMFEMLRRFEDKTARHLELSLSTHSWESNKRTIKIGG